LKKNNVCCWDLEGPISVIDFAAEIGKLLSKKPELKLQNYDMGDFFFMISNYDDYLIDEPGVKEKLNIPDYQPGDTLRIMAPLYVACYSEEELISLARKDLGLLPGCKELMSILHKNWDVYVISTSYTQFAHNVTAALNIPQDHVYCTDLHVKELKESVSNIEESVNILVKEIFQKYHDNESRFVHIFPARSSPHTFRIKANTLKSAILYLVLIGKDYVSEDDLNKARALAGLSPIREVADAEAVTEMIEILRR